MNPYLALFIGVACAGIGGELFIRGTVGLARWARISAGIIGVTVAAFGTSSPELSVATTSALAGTPDIALGDALGSNILNIALILGISLLFGPMHGASDDVKRDLPMAVLAPLLLGLLALDGTLSRLDGGILMAVFFTWLGFVTAAARRQRECATAEVVGEHRGVRAVFYTLLGLVLLIAAGRFIVTGATGVALSFGLSAFVIGAVVVAVGTSVPELATTVLARLRGHDEVGLGTILGSNIFNGLFIIAVAALISPIPIVWPQVPIALLFGLVVVLCIIPGKRGVLQRWRGVALLGLYLVYVAVTLAFPGHTAAG